MAIKLFNTLTRKFEKFVPLVSGHIGFYSCGPTVYSFSHIGNMRAYIHADLMKRMFLSNGYEVRHVMNLTDVGHLTSDSDTGEDKMEKGAKRENKSVWEISKMYADAFFADTDDLNIIRPTVVTKATDYIREQIDMIKKLEDLGYTYKIDGDGIYYDTSKFSSYESLAGGNIKGNKAGARVEFNEAKRNPTDFALWKFSPTDTKRQMEWDSPWGIGFPGWHIECSAMSMAELGPHFDIHTGGTDHIPIHHTNEIAQAEPIVGSPWVNYWVHFEFLLDHTGKMSKSNGEFLTLSSVKSREYDPMHYRYLITLGHYQSQIAFSWEAMDAARNGYERIVRKIAGLIDDKERTADKEKSDFWKNRMLMTMNDNMKTAETLVIFQEMLRDLETDDTTKLAVADFIDNLLGLRFLENAKKLGVSEEIPSEIMELARQRASAKVVKNFISADKFRAEIDAAGWTVIDSKDGYEIVRKR
ncbi:MAG: cysteine--tRNA ligase [Rickettsiales bacterium]|jgi:cysteinyl-tRNA synthetase|nr:cysteine--tRNA ligase [Rickettsiales bacterium]